ncbi:hypothetical protein [Cyanobium sp. Morenito 9A2]|uniref:hypothetical protein n=1 Tax=Cyanobium sp. Morenito 9A2 TaxID=2823718 RepID=UPI0020CFC868|nr:hypothetical protein [Cyanobium sp. Morenito 9A2]MCP9848942.1 hypothetical protein [Cyanobium sp. Morenito 9A2]
MVGSQVLGQMGSEFGRRLRQFLALFVVFVLSADLPIRVFHIAQHLIWGGPGISGAVLEHGLPLLAVGVALVCALYLAQGELGTQRLIASYPPSEPVPLALHGLGLLSGLIMLLLER